LFLTITLFWAAGLAAACADDVFRKVTLQPAVVLPSGHATADNDTIYIEIEPGELLAEGHHLVAWAATAAGTVRLGDFESGGHLTGELSTAGITAADIERVLVTEEEEHDPALPSIVVFLSGALPGELMFVGLIDHDFEQASAEAEIQNGRITISAGGLPTLPRGFLYGVWVVLDEHDEVLEQQHSHLTARSAGHDDGGGHVETGAVFAGQLSGGVLLDNELDVLLASGHEVIVSIESENGVASMSKASVLSGEIVLTGETDPEEGDGHGDHLH
jgi:hypothetical protein